MQNKHESPKITVAIRKRPLSKKEQQRNETDIIRIQDQGTVVVSEVKQKVDLTKYIEETSFDFDYAFNEYCNNQSIYDCCIQPLIDSAFMGAKVSCFAYGQTGSGKTYTMRGDSEMPGLYYLGAKEIFRYLDHPNFQHMQVHVSFFEIYCGKLYDLLNKRTELKIREDKHNNINIIGMEEKYICSAGEFLEVIEYGSTFRITSQNATNSQSSRSHAILQISIREGKKVFTKISFIDLAGNERGADHMDQNKQTMIDGAQINKSLLALKECIRALDQGKGHTPFRGSKLTMVLKDSFVGFCKTVMIGTVSPNVTSAQNTMNTLRYADRVKQLRNGGDGPMSKQDQVAREMMLPRANKNTLKVNINRGDDDEDIQIKKQAARKLMVKRNTSKIEPSQMDIEVPRRRTQIIHHNQNFTKNDRKSMNVVGATNNRHPIEPQDQNNPRGRNFNFLRDPSSKNLQLKVQQTKQKTQELLNLNSQPTKNKVTGFPRTQINNQYKMQYDYHNMMQEIESMKQQFLSDHFSSIKQQSYIIKQQSEMCDRVSRNPHFDLNSYIQDYQRVIDRKLQIFTQMKRKADLISGKLKQSNNLNKALGEMNSFDQQLLEGLPVDDFGGKLF